MNFVKTLPDNPFTVIEHQVISSLPNDLTSDYKHNFIKRLNMINKSIKELCGWHEFHQVFKFEHYFIKRAYVIIWWLFNNCNWKFYTMHLYKYFCYISDNYHVKCKNKHFFKKTSLKISFWYRVMCEKKIDNIDIKSKTFT